MFNNVVVPIDEMGQSMKSEHHLTYEITWATPILLLATMGIFLVVVKLLFEDYLAMWGFQMSDQEIKVDEDLPNFFDTIKLSSANEIIKEVENMEENFGFEHNDPDTIDNLERCKNTFPVKEIQGTPWYQILSNPSYVSQFNYIGAFVGEREKLIEDGYHDDYVDEEETEMTADCKRARYEQSD